MLKLRGRHHVYATPSVKPDVFRQCAFKQNHKKHTHRIMKSIITLVAVLGIAAVSYSADDAKKPAEAGKAKPDQEAVFKKKDANNDGKLTKEEFLKGAKADKTEAMTKMFEAKDKDKDGSLTLDEFKAGGKKKNK